MNSNILSAAAFASALAFSPSALAQVMADVCPPFGFINDTNHVLNPSFEKADRSGDDMHSAAKHWLLHTSNDNAPISSELVATTVPHGSGPSEGKRMIHIDAGGNEGGVYQFLPPELIHSKLMFSVWVNVKKGHIAMQLGSFVGSPAGFSTKHNQWEELRVCSNGNPDAPAQDTIFIGNEDAEGGHFDVDRVEVRETQ